MTLVSYREAEFLLYLVEQNQFSLLQILGHNCYARGERRIVCKEYSVGLLVRLCVHESFVVPSRSRPCCVSDIDTVAERISL